MSLLKDTIALSQITKPLNEQKFFDGQKSKRYEFVATLKKRIELDTQWGVSVLFIFVTDLEETLSMFYSGYKFDCEDAHQMGDKWMTCSMQNLTIKKRG